MYCLTRLNHFNCTFGTVKDYVENHPEPRVLTSNQKGQNYCFGITQQYYEVYSTLFFLKIFFVIGFSTGPYLHPYN